MENKERYTFCQNAVAQLRKTVSHLKKQNSVQILQKMTEQLDC